MSRDENPPFGMSGPTIRRTMVASRSRADMHLAYRCTDVMGGLAHGILEGSHTDRLIERLAVDTRNPDTKCQQTDSK